MLLERTAELTHGQNLLCFNRVQIDFRTAMQKAECKFFHLRSNFAFASRLFNGREKAGNTQGHAAAVLLNRACSFANDWQRETWEAKECFEISTDRELPRHTAALLMPLVRFIGPTDPGWRSTFQVINHNQTPPGVTHLGLSARRTTWIEFWVRRVIDEIRANVLAEPSKVERSTD